MNDKEFQSLAVKIEREFPMRIKLAALAGYPKLNSKNFKACMEFEATIADIFLEIALKHPENMLAALSIIRGD